MSCLENPIELKNDSKNDYFQKKSHGLEDLNFEFRFVLLV